MRCQPAPEGRREPATPTYIGPPAAPSMAVHITIQLPHTLPTAPTPQQIGITLNFPSPQTTPTMTAMMAAQTPTRTLPTRLVNSPPMEVNGSKTTTAMHGRYYTYVCPDAARTTRTTPVGHARPMARRTARRYPVEVPARDYSSCGRAQK